METDTEQEDEKEKKEKEQKEEMEALAKKGLAHCFYDALKPYFDKLSDLKLLERCKDGFTQNQNESFNGMIWNHAPKHKYFGYQMIRTATNMATAYFNDGAKSYADAMSAMNIELNHISLKAFQKMNQERIETAERRKRDSTKERRIELRRKKAKKMEAAKKGEGTTYQAGGFGDDEGPPRKKAKRSAEPAPKKAAPKKPKKAAPKKPKKAAPRKSAKGGATAWQVVSDKGWTIHCHG